MNKRHYEHTLPNIRGSLSNTYGEMKFLTFSFCQFDIDTPSLQVTEQCRMGQATDFQMLETRFCPTLGKRKTDRADVRCLFRYPV